MDQETTRNLIDYLVTRHGYDWSAAVLTASDLSEWYDDMEERKTKHEEALENLVSLGVVHEQSKTWTVQQEELKAWAKNYNYPLHYRSL